jgi:hypothetical protein
MYPLRWGSSSKPDLIPCLAVPRPNYRRSAHQSAKKRWAFGPTFLDMKPNRHSIYNEWPDFLDREPLQPDSEGTAVGRYPKAGG